MSQLTPELTARYLCFWLQQGTYRVIMHRHDGMFRAIDESERKKVEAETLPLLADAIADWDTTAKRYGSPLVVSTHQTEERR